MSNLAWTSVPDQELLPVYGPPCGVTPQGHRWFLSISEGTISLWSGCEECTEAVLAPAGNDILEMYTTITGSLTFESDGPDCYWWVFHPQKELL